jgi:hypothetical protein
MAFAYTIRDQSAMHFVTFTVHQCVDVFTRKTYIDILLENLKYCQQLKVLRLLRHSERLITVRNKLGLRRITNPKYLSFDIANVE